MNVLDWAVFLVIVLRSRTVLWDLASSHQFRKFWPLPGHWCSSVDHLPLSSQSGGWWERTRRFFARAIFHLRGCVKVKVRGWNSHACVTFFAMPFPSTRLIHSLTTWRAVYIVLLALCPRALRDLWEAKITVFMLLPRTELLTSILKLPPGAAPSSNWVVKSYISISLDVPLLCLLPVT